VRDHHLLCAKSTVVFMSYMSSNLEIGKHCHAKLLIFRTFTTTLMATHWLDIATTRDNGVAALICSSGNLCYRMHRKASKCEWLMSGFIFGFKIGGRTQPSSGFSKTIYFFGIMLTRLGLYIEIGCHDSNADWLIFVKNVTSDH